MELLRWKKDGKWVRCCLKEYTQKTVKQLSLGSEGDFSLYQKCVVHDKVCKAKTYKISLPWHFSLTTLYNLLYLTLNSILIAL